MQKESPWLTLTGASELLGVHPTTLRAWADAGLVRAFLTPGGHRRFMASELRAFIEQRRSDSAAHTLLVAPDRTLQQVRQQLDTQTVTRQGWFQRMSDVQRSHHRLTGQRLLGLLIQFVSREENADHFLSEARDLAREYGNEFALAGSSIVELAQAFMLFRRMIVNAAYGSANVPTVNDSEGMRLWQRINLFMDELLIATLESFEKGIAAATPTRRIPAKTTPARGQRKPMRRATR